MINRSPNAHDVAISEINPAVSPRRLTRSEGEGCRTVPMEQLDSVLADFSLIINTVPAMLLDETRLQAIRKDALVLDLASKPGGDDAGDKKAKCSNTLRKNKGCDCMGDSRWTKSRETLCSGILIAVVGVTALVVMKMDEPSQELSKQIDVQTAVVSEMQKTEEATQTERTTTAEETTIPKEITTETTTPDRNLNTADAAALKRVSGVGDILAEAILDYRAEIGGFTRRAQLLDVPGIGEVLMARIMTEFEIPDELPPETTQQVQPIVADPPAEPEIPAETESVLPDEPETEPPVLPMDVNLVTLEELMRIPDMTEETAEAILDMRQRLGRYRGIYEVTLVEEVDGAYFENVLRRYLYVVGDPNSVAQP